MTDSKMFLHLFVSFDSLRNGVQTLKAIITKLIKWSHIDAMKEESILNLHNSDNCPHQCFHPH